MNRRTYIGNSSSASVDEKESNPNAAYTKTVPIFSVGETRRRTIEEQIISKVSRKSGATPVIAGATSKGDTATRVLAVASCWQFQEA